MAKSSSEERLSVARGMLTGAILSVVIFLVGINIFPIGMHQKLSSVTDHVIFTLRCQSFSALTLLIGIARIASMRFFTTAIDPISGKGEQLVAVDSRYLQNTLEQLVLSILGQIILSTYLTTGVVTRVIPSLVTLFVIGRVLFYMGYSASPVKRAAGFGMTFYPSIVVYVYCLLRYFGLE